jgi:CO/xanthine dehydrogenase Mo-binding subunit
MAVRIEAGIDASGRIGAWTLELWTMPHARRPGVGGVNLLSATRLTHPAPLPPADEIPLPMGGGDRNAVALYDFPDHEVIRHFIPDPPIRTSSLRALGGHANVFAIESMMDELAEAAGADPLEFRLRHLTEPRGRRVLEAVARLSGWNRSRPAGGEGLGWGLAFARYKNTGGYAAIVAEAAAEDEARITRVWCAADLGRVITRNGALNQIEGGIVQSLSWALYEAAPLGPRGVEARTWKDYPILRFSQTPRITVELVDARDEPPLGAGEVVQGAATAAAANAVAHALGVRVRRLPLSRDHIVAALSAESRTSQSSAAAEQTSREQS